MWIFIIRRLLALPPLLLVISCLTYGLLQLAPGDFFKKLEENPTVQQDYVMGLRRSAGKAIEVAAEDRADRLGTFRVGENEFSFDAEGLLLVADVPTVDPTAESPPVNAAQPEGDESVTWAVADPRVHQTAIKKFTWPEGEDGDTWTVTEQGRVYRWVGAWRGYFAWLGNVLSGDLGQSFQYKTSVATVIGERLTFTLLLSIAALMIAWGLAIPLGVWSGVRPNSLVDHLCGATAYLGLSIPSVFLALLAVLLAYYTGWFPVGNARDHVGWDDMTRFERALDILHHLVLPACVVGFTTLAGYMRQTRGQMVETMSQDYVRTARAKGVAHNVVIFKHALRNAINPLVTLFGFSIAGLLSGSFLVEVVMNWPGLARVVVDAVFSKDEPLVLAATLMTAVLLVLGNLVADVMLGIVDPRIRLD